MARKKPKKAKLTRKPKGRVFYSKKNKKWCAALRPLNGVGEKWLGCEKTEPKARKLLNKRRKAA